jgi:hypothetical protein
VRIVGMPLSATMTVLRLADGGLLVHSPIALTTQRRVAVEGFGKVAHLYAPSSFHHLWMEEWAAAFPAARVHAPRSLARKRPALRIDRYHVDAAEPAFEGRLEEHHIDGLRLDESVLLYRPAETLVVADLVHNIGAPPQLWTKLYAGAMGFYDRLALSRMIRWAGFSDRATARRSIDALLALPFDKLIVGHGAALASGGKDAIAAAYDWLH